MYRTFEEYYDEQYFRPSDDILLNEIKVYADIIDQTYIGLSDRVKLPKYEYCVINVLQEI